MFLAGEAITHVRAESIWPLSVPSEFCYEILLWNCSKKKSIKNACAERPHF